MLIILLEVSLCWGGVGCFWFFLSYVIYRVVVEAILSLCHRGCRWDSYSNAYNGA